MEDRDLLVPFTLIGMNIISLPKAVVYPAGDRSDIASGSAIDTTVSKWYPVFGGNYVQIIPNSFTACCVEDMSTA